MLKSESSARGLEIFGLFLLFVSAGFGFLFLYAIMRELEWMGRYSDMPPHFADDTIFLLIGVCVLITGLGLLGRRRWAAIIFSVPGLILTVRFAIGFMSASSLGLEMSDSVALNAGILWIVTLPSILSVSCWKLLRWRGSTLEQ